MISRQNVYLPVKKLKYRQVWGFDFDVFVMDIREIAAEKIRAMSERARYRDFYDFYLIIKQYRFSLKNLISLLGHKELRYPISSISIRDHWRMALDEKQRKTAKIYYSETIKDFQLESLVESLILELSKSAFSS